MEEGGFVKDSVLFDSPLNHADPTPNLTLEKIYTHEPAPTLLLSFFFSFFLFFDFFSGGENPLPVFPGELVSPYFFGTSFGVG